MQVKQYRKKPVVVEAVLWDGTAKTATPIIDWMLASGGTCRYHGELDTVLPQSIYIDTLEGSMAASPGDYIIKGVNGEFYPCRADIFKQTYEAVFTKEAE